MKSSTAESGFARVLTSSPFNVVINNVFWAGCVGGRYELIWVVAPAVVIYVAILVYYGKVNPSQLLFIVLCGILIDSIFTVTGLLQFDQSKLLLPLWMAVLWAAFATTLPLSLRFLGKNLYLAAVTGAIGFPFSYYIGAKIGAVSFGLPFPWMAVILASTWAIFLPLMFIYLNRSKGYSFA